MRFARHNLRFVIIEKNSIHDLEEQIQRKQELLIREKNERIAKLSKDLQTLEKELSSETFKAASSGSHGDTKTKTAVKKSSAVDSMDLRNFQELQRHADNILEDLMGKKFNRA